MRVLDAQGLRGNRRDGERMHLKAHERKMLDARAKKDTTKWHDKSIKTRRNKLNSGRRVICTFGGGVVGRKLPTPRSLSAGRGQAASWRTFSAEFPSSGRKF